MRCVVSLDFVPYHTFYEARRIGASVACLVLGVSNMYRCLCGGRREVRFAVFEEADCAADPRIFVEVARRASVEAFGEDLVAMVVRTGKGFHVYLDRWRGGYFEALLDAARFRNALPAACRDERHVWLAIEMLQRFRWYRYVLRVSNTKWPWDRFDVVYYRAPSDPCHRAYLEEVRRLYSAPAPAP